MKLNRIALLLPLSALFALSGCAYLPLYGSGQQHISSRPPRAVKSSARYSGRSYASANHAYTVPAGDVDPKIQPYSVGGTTYWPVQSALGFRQEGYASWYGMDFHGKRTATGETYDMFSVSAAHKTLPLGSKVRVTNLENGRQLELTINDRGPFVNGRIIDLSYAAARLLGMADNGLAHVRVEGVADNPVLARRNAGGTVLASRSSRSAHRARPQFVERSLGDDAGGAADSHVRSGRSAALPAVADAESGRYRVQVGAFARDENARKVRERLVRDGLRNVVVRRSVYGGRELSVVLVGGFERREQAEEALENVRDEFPQSFINTGA